MARLLLTETELRLVANRSATSASWRQVDALVLHEATGKVVAVRVPPGGGTEYVLEIDPRNFGTDGRTLVAFLEKHRP